MLRIIEYGVRQGCVLGPVLFLLNINLMSDLNPDWSVLTYADDTGLFFSRQVLGRSSS